MIAIQNETLVSLFEQLNISEDNVSAELVKLADADSKYLKDLKINVQNSLNYPNLTKKESALLALSIALNEKNNVLIPVFEQMATENGASAEEVAETVAVVSMMNVNNVFYRFRHYTNKDYYNQTPAGIKMSVMMSPVLGKEFFELMSLAVSAVNGCEMCVNAHEDSVIKHGATQARVYDAIRLSAIIKGFAAIL
ncbi:carboxymuconolactone decarboxylase family protein [Solitalea canadensis]|uniref:Alkyl hydroperoxide reductase AhpD n=1 Tax=Solitalea canadensis (strain ATCC 29591 / DSM 3403 / JCM 21819 / LMG 8368 / NBRC 15130 / NCIMB 12057 / USAM 9D) TaxID=929556 RepID=H8KW05_SOLCM|nr:carboxymuconolactone decarboxylase family protein [Solitalea canadensis]AFD06908.1 alkylhydroperoxidase AhpD family core domain protein [Solitalea canadensis DSM 3403]